MYSRGVALVVAMALAAPQMTLAAQTQTTAPMASQAAAIYAVVHVDVEPPDIKVALPLLRAYAQQAAQDPAVLHLDVLQQADAPNHFTLVETLRSHDAYDHFVAESYVKTMRDKIQPLLGSPFDERLHKAAFPD